MRQSFFLLIGLLLLTCARTQTEAQKHTRDLAVDRVADALFETQAKPVRDRHKAFEKANGVKLHFTVEDASLDQLGGLSEHLFKIYKTLVTPVNVQAKTVTGEFSVLDNDVLADILKYRTNATKDLRNCAFPESDTRHLDSLYTKGLSDLPLTPQEINEVPAGVNELLNQAAYDYEKILRDHPGCEGLTNSEFDIHVLNTRGNRSESWNSDAQSLSNSLSVNLGLLRSSAGTGGANNNGHSGVNLNIDPNSFSGHHIVNLNNSVNECTRRDMEARCRMLYKKTGIRFLYVTKTLNYFLPRDSMNLFRDLATASFSTELTEDLIVALYLKMTDASTGASGTTLLVKQLNGEWLTNGEIQHATYNNGGSYQDNTYYRFVNLFKNIPKPLIICYQVAKVNGLFTTMYLQKATAVKGWEQIYQHIFKVDKTFREVSQLAGQIEALHAAGSGGSGTIMGTGGMGASGPLAEQVAELRTRLKLAYLKAAAAPELVDADVQFREVYLQDFATAEASGLKHIQVEYGGLYKNNKFGELIGNGVIPADINAGSCLTPDNSDAVGGFLDLSSLVLSPTGLDLIPDALATLYYAANGETLNMMLASASFFMPGSLAGAKSIVQNAGEALSAVNRGSRLLKQGGAVEAIDPNVSYITSFFRIDPAEVSPALVSKINAQLTVTKKLTAMDGNGNLPVTSAQAAVWRNTERLPPAKRIEFVNKCYDEAAFRNKCFDDPDEVLRWGGPYLENIPDENTIDVLSKDILFLPGPTLPPKIAYTFVGETYTNRKLISNETFYKYHGTDNRTGKKYAWFTNKKYSSEFELRQKLAIREDWGVQIQFVTEFDVPAQTWVSEGKAAAQGEGYPGQDYQAVILNAAKSWIVKTESAWN